LKYLLNASLGYKEDASHSNATAVQGSPRCDVDVAQRILRAHNANIRSDVEHSLPPLIQNLRRSPITHIPTKIITNPDVEVSTKNHADIHPHPANILLGTPVNRLQDLTLIGLISALEVPVPKRLPQRIHKVDIPGLAVALSAPRSHCHAFQSFFIDMVETTIRRVLRLGFSLRILGRNGFTPRSNMGNASSSRTERSRSNKREEKASRQLLE
jgi:hypothetical protein